MYAIRCAPPRDIAETFEFLSCRTTTGAAAEELTISTLRLSHIDTKHNIMDTTFTKHTLLNQHITKKEMTVFTRAETSER